MTRAAAPAPAVLAACPGKTRRLLPSTAAICYGCSRYGLRAEAAIEPRAAFDQASQTWHCPDRVGTFAFANRQD